MPKGTAQTTFPLADDYRATAERLAGQELALDWRRLGDEEPPNWPGSLYLFSATLAEEENARFRELVGPEELEDLYFFGNNAAGIVYAFHRKGHVLIFDEIEVGDDDGITIAESFSALLRARVDA